MVIGSVSYIYMKGLNNLGGFQQTVLAEAEELKNKEALRIHRKLSLDCHLS